MSPDCCFIYTTISVGCQFLASCICWFVLCKVAVLVVLFACCCRMHGQTDGTVVVVDCFEPMQC